VNQEKRADPLTGSDAERDRDRIALPKHTRAPARLTDERRGRRATLRYSLAHFLSPLAIPE